MRDLLQNPDLGRTNIRPAIMDQASKLLSSRVLSLPEVMSAIGKVGDDPLAQKSLVAGIFNQASKPRTPSSRTILLRWRWAWCRVGVRSIRRPTTIGICPVSSATTQIRRLKTWPM